MCQLAFAHLPGSLRTFPLAALFFPQPVPTGQGLRGFIPTLPFPKNAISHARPPPSACRVAEISLRMLDIEATLSSDTAKEVLISSKRQYRLLSMAVHPDRQDTPPQSPPPPPPPLPPFGMHITLHICFD
jgi:hypothetical protein